MRNKLSLALAIAVFAVPGFAKLYEEPKSFSLKDKSQEQVERKILPKIDTERPGSTVNDAAGCIVKSRRLRNVRSAPARCVSVPVN